MYLGMLHGLLHAVSCPDTDECPYESWRFLGLRKAAMEMVGCFFFLHRFDVWRMVNFFLVWMECSAGLEYILILIEFRVNLLGVHLFLVRYPI